jgi:hypothetical protein
MTVVGKNCGGCHDYRKKTILLIDQRRSRGSASDGEVETIALSWQLSRPPPPMP